MDSDPFDLDSDPFDEAAVDCIRTALSEKSPVMPFLDPYLAFFDPVRDDPAFVRLLAELESQEW